MTTAEAPLARLDQATQMLAEAMTAMTSDAHLLDSWPEDDTGDERVDSLVLLDKARAFLALAETLPDIGHVRAIADRAARYARAAKLGRAAENHATKLRVDAERKAGALLPEMERQGLGRPEKRSDDPTFSPPKLADLGISKQQSSDWQAMARLPDDVYDQHVHQIVSAKRSLTTAGLVEVARKLERQQRIATLPRVVLTRPDVRLDVANALDMPLADASVDVIITSPPYGLEKPYRGHQDLAAGWEQFMEDWLKEGLRVLSSPGRLILNVPMSTALGGFRATWPQAYNAALAAGFTYRGEILWDKGSSTKGHLSLGSQESADAPYPVAEVEVIGLFFKGAWKLGGNRPSDMTHAEWQAWGNGLWKLPGETRPWEGHPAPYTEELVSRLLRYLTRVGDEVLDPFVGSGTTALAAVDLGRRVIGSDIDEACIESSKRRLVAAGVAT